MYIKFIRLTQLIELGQRLSQIVTPTGTIIPGGGGILARNQFTTCPLEGLCEAALDPVKDEKLQEIVQDRQEDPSQFLEHLTKALLKCTNLDLKTQRADNLLMIYFFQSFSELGLSLGIWREDPLPYR